MSHQLIVAIGRESGSGGTFTVQNKILPGAYYQFRASGNTVSMGARGIAAAPLV